MMAYDDAATVCIVALEPDIRPSEFLLDVDTCTIGRSPLCQIVVRHSTVSRLHAKIERQGAVCVLTDVGSANGTFVNGQRITSPHFLCDRDNIGLGDTTAALLFRTATSSRAGG
jgi:pSer/pThr/pTyr-binding forkhead associated (FHA) protein